MISFKSSIALSYQRGEVESTFLFPFELYVWWLLVQAYAKSFQLFLNQSFVLQRFEHIQYDKNESTSSGNWKTKKTEPSADM